MATIHKRRSKDGTISFQAKVRMLGISDSATFRRKTDAVRWAKETEDLIQAGRYFTVSEAKAHTISDGLERYYREGHIDSLKDKDRLKRKLDWFHKEYGARTFAQFTAATVSEIRSRLLNENGNQNKKRGGQTVNRYISAYSRFFDTAQKEWLWIDANPFKQVRRFKETLRYGRTLTPEERDRLLECADSSNSANMRLLVPLALGTGCRRGELLSLRWPDVNFAEGYFTLSDTKNGDTRRVHVIEPVLSLLKSHAKVRRIDTDLVFAGKDSATSGKPFELNKPWKRLLKKADIQNFRFHDLRHSCGTFLAENGVSALDIKNILGHKTLAMALRYTHLAEGRVRSVHEKITTRMFAS